MRCFIAITLDKDTQNEISRVQEKIKFPGVKLVKVSNLHITLCFLGDITSKKMEQVICELDEINTASFKIKFQNVGIFPNNQKPRIIWAGINSEELDKLSKYICEILDIEYKSQPHVSFARIKKINSNIVANIQQIKKEYCNYIFGNMIVQNIKLIKSELTPRGPIYSKIYLKKLK